MHSTTPNLALKGKIGGVSLSINPEHTLAQRPESRGIDFRTIDSRE